MLVMMTSPTHEENLRFWKRSARWYDRLMAHVAPEYETMVERTVADAEPAERVLEVGTGTGRIALALAGRAQQVEAIDYAPEMLDIARRRVEEHKPGQVRFSIQNVCSLDFPDAHFDVVVCANVLHMIVDSDQALAQIHRVLKPRGLLIAPTYCHGETPLSIVLSSGMRLAGLRAYHKWSLDSFRRFVEAGRFEVIRDDVITGLIPMCYLMGRRVG
jgi:phosphatidylethanolamine/phosphatidyl-N-methylethanolamine N-methyltransferase